ncbi:carbamoyl-phosphate synthase large subunit [Halospina denitrificans]|uniref:Carbamoyl-phosphate synthase large subunit n=1 Tax=Halospina denitrificans TaxID=332522 RepID=A0A4R7JZR2_9GAMM|nr:ATP-grasp domain-containing protein [Halospina denitrificans]TDT43474.1 carbamoyl-phosphate synthase large subunit [Halospina denitrificans]
MLLNRPNILVLSAGRRVELVRFLQRSLADYVGKGAVYTTDMVPETSAACQVTEKAFSVPRATDANYVEALLDICHEYDVGLVVPTIDPELEILAREKNRFREMGVEPVVSEPELLSACHDKRKTGNLFLSLGIGYPEVYDSDQLRFPCFCKPFDGSRSVGAKVIESASSLSEQDRTNPKNMFMELIPSSYAEYTVDGYYGLDHQLKALVCRERLEVRDGEVSKGITRKDFAYEHLVNRLKSVPGAVGCITFQFFVNSYTQDVKGLEINPRFGGGYPLTHQSGAPFTDYLVREYFLGDSLLFNGEWQDGLMMLRYDAAVYCTHDD